MNDNGKKEKTTDTGETPVPQGQAGAAMLPVPAGFVVLRKIRGPEGTHWAAGTVVTGGLYTVAIAVGLQMTMGKEPEFEPATAEDTDKLAKARKRDKAE